MTRTEAEGNGSGFQPIFSHMTIERAREIYLVAGGDRYHDEAQWPVIRAEMDALVAAPGIDEAAKIIEYWDCWYYRGEPASAFAARVRSLVADQLVR